MTDSIFFEKDMIEAESQGSVGPEVLISSLVNVHVEECVL